MTYTALPIDSHPVCANPGWLPIVDAAFDRPGGPAAHDLAQYACPSCPVREECLLLSMVGEYGPWGGTSANARTRLGAPAARSRHNVAGIEHGVRRAVPPAPAPTKLVKTWARSQGIPVSVRGRPAAAVYAAYADAHPDLAQAS